MSPTENSGIEIIKVRSLISPLPLPNGVGETVYAEISNDYFGTNASVPVFGSEFRYRIEGKNLEGPIPSGYRTGFPDVASARLAAELELRQLRAGDIPEGTKMPRESVWRTRYRRKRYLAAFADEVLVKRFADIANLLFTLSESNKIGIRHPTEEADIEYLSEVHTHVLEEFVLRRHKAPYPMDAYFESNAWPLPDFSTVKLRKSDSIWKGLSLNEGKYLIKYGKLKYLEAFFETGVTRIAPATIYSDPSLNPSIKDDELSISGFAKSPFVSSSSISNDPNDESFGSGTLKFTYEANSNFYVYCLAGIYDRRLLSDFEADCFLVIKEPRRFCQELLDAGMLQLGNVSGKAVPVKYFDPFIVDPSSLNPYTAKDFRYSFQAEYRLFWIPNTPTWELEPINVQMPRIKDYCELVRLAVPDEPS